MKLDLRSLPAEPAGHRYAQALAGGLTTFKQSSGLAARSLKSQSHNEIVLMFVKGFKIFLDLRRARLNLKTKRVFLIFQKAIRSAPWKIASLSFMKFLRARCGRAFFAILFGREKV